MDGFNVGKILAGLMNPELYLKKINQNGINGEQNFNSAFSQSRPHMPQNPVNDLILNNMLQNCHLCSHDVS